MIEEDYSLVKYRQRLRHLLQMQGLKEVNIRQCGLVGPLEYAEYPKECAKLEILSHKVRS